MGRVGRHGEKCRRFVVESISLIDSALHIDFRKRLIRFLGSKSPMASAPTHHACPESSSKTRAKKMIETANSLPTQANVNKMFGIAQKK